MKTNIMLITTTFLIGVGTGYWSGAPLKKYSTNDYYAIARDNNALLEKIVNRNNAHETGELKPSVTGDCQNYSGLLSDIRKTIIESIKNLPAESATTIAAANRATEPSKKQVRTYHAVKNRIYSYANSGRPVMDAMSEDPDIQSLTHEQQRQLAMEIIGRFNRGEITMDQIQGH